ncbi:MAG: hypothetical protein Q8M19_14155 [Reyranella sp.]|nr:hypothetical protein [Reyranella sp.]
MTDVQKPINDDSDNEDHDAARGGDAGGRTDSQRAAATYAWEYFKYHAQQRQAVFRFFLVIAGALFAAYLLSFQSTAADLKDARPLIAAMLAVMSFLFWRLDVRSYQLVKLAEDYLVRDEGSLATALGTEDVRLIGRSNEAKPKRVPLKWFASFRLIYAWVFFFVGALGLYLLAWDRALEPLKRLVACTGTWF